MHHRGTRDLEVLGRHQLPAGIDHVVAEEGGAEEVDPEEDQLAGHRVELGVGTHRRCQRPVEVVHLRTVEVGGEPVGESGLHQGESAPGVADHVGVGLAVHGFEGATGRGGARFGGEGTGAHPPVAVPGCLPARERDGVDHAVAGEPVVAGGIGGHRDRVGAVAEEPTLEIGGEHPGHREVAGAALLLHGGEVS